MAINTKNRSELKAYFVKNAIPTEANFAELVDAQLNQADDGVFKLGDDPLSIVAAPGDQKRVLRLYEQYPSSTPSWTLSLKPRTNISDAKTAASGLGFDGPDGTNRLFLAANGKLGLGTTKPADKLTVRGGDIRVEGGNYRRIKVVSDTYWAGIELVARNTDKKGGHPHIDFTHGDLDNPNYGLRLVATSNDKLMIDGASLGIGRDPDRTLDVGGDAVVRGVLATTGGIRLSGNRDDDINVDGAFYRKGNNVWLTVDDALYIRDSGSSNWGIALNTNNGSVTAKGGLTIGGGNNTSHIENDGAFYRFDAQVYMTVDERFFFRDKGSDSWAVQVTTNDGVVNAKGGVIVGSGERSNHLNNDGAFYRKSGQAWITVDDHLYVRDTKSSSNNWTHHFNTDSGHLALTGNMNVKGGTLTLGGWTLVADGDHLFFKKGKLTIARISTTHDRIQFYRNRDAKAPYWYFNSKGKSGVHS